MGALGALRALRALRTLGALRVLRHMGGGRLLGWFRGLSRWFRKSKVYKLKLY